MTLTYPTAIQNLAAAARVAMQFGQTPEAAADLVAGNAMEEGTKAVSRGGMWRTETTSEQIEDAVFMAAVGADILNGTIERPSVGNVRAALLAAITPTPATAAEHRITVEFIGTDMENPPESRNRYAVTCSCNGQGVAVSDSLSHSAADRRIALHLNQVGLWQESFTQH